MNRPRSTPWFWIILSALTLFIVGGFGLILIATTVGGGEGGSSLNPRVGLVELSGAIMDEGAGSLIGGRSRGARDVIKALDAAREDESIKAVVIRINSPGGSAAASQEMFNAVRRLKATKPVVCSMGDVAASGGYYVAAACDSIYANGSTLTGSIGVISQFVNYSYLFQKGWLGQETVKSGRFKDAGNPSRPLTPAERELFQAMVMNVYGQFVNDVLEGRKGKLTRAQLLKLADGRVYTGVQARDNKLIDAIGGLHEAVREAARLGNIQGEPKIKEVNVGGSLFGSLMGAHSEAALSSALGDVGVAAGRAAGESFANSLARQMKAENTVPELR
ncbi:MAG TPA: signal peptide peptidase SppA [Abditibacteriaceae bacterium]|jgi:protease-4